jgi:hypothetical protein
MPCLAAVLGGDGRIVENVKQAEELRHVEQGGSKYLLWSFVAEKQHADRHYRAGRLTESNVLRRYVRLSSLT